MYRQDKSKYHEIKSYDLIQFMTSDRNTWSFDDMCHLKNNLYEFSNNEIKDLNNYCDRDFKLFEKKQDKKENKEESKVYFADTETDTSGINYASYGRYNHARLGFQESIFSFVYWVKRIL